MRSRVSIRAIYECSLERAFKTPFLCDVKKIHDGYWLSPKIVGVIDDSKWGRPGSHKKIITATSKRRGLKWDFKDAIIERVENEYWKIEVGDFQSYMYGFDKFKGEWRTTQVKSNKILIEYSYELFSKSPLYYPIHWIIAKTYWRIYMKRVVEMVRDLAYSDAPYLYD